MFHDSLEVFAGAQSWIAGVLSAFLPVTTLWNETFHGAMIPYGLEMFAGAPKLGCPIWIQ